MYLCSTFLENVPKEKIIKTINDISNKIFDNFFSKKNNIIIVKKKINVAFLSPVIIITKNSPKNNIFF